jgi:hypothetical protein
MGAPEENPGASRQTALVAAAEDPIDNRLRGKGYRGWVRILVEGSPPIFSAARFKLDPDHWLVRGQEIPVMIDPAQPEAFEVVWDEVPAGRGSACPLRW